MKRIIISAETLRPALGKLSQVVNIKAPLPVLSHLLCRVTPGQIELIGSNTEITIFYRLECESQESFDFLLPFDFINKIVAINKHCPIEIEAAKKVKIKGPNDVYELKVSEKMEEFPKLPDVPKKNSIEINGEILTTLQTAIASTANVNTNAMLSHVLLELGENKITIASSDGAYMVYSKEFTSLNQETEELLISQKIIKVLDGSDSVKLSWHKTAISFEKQDITIINTRSESKFVNFRAVFPPDWPGNLTLKKADLVEALDKCSLSTSHLHMTKLNLETTGCMKLHADDHMVNINVNIDASYTGEVKETAINSEKLSRLLGQINAEEIILALHNDKKAILITTSEDSGYMGMIMPIAVSN